MINESEGDELGEEMAEGLDQPGVIQVSPQDKKAIERVGTFLLQMLCRRDLVPVPVHNQSFQRTFCLVSRQIVYKMIANPLFLH
jgi:hypothetical protein